MGTWAEGVKVHETAVVDPTAVLGAGTVVWAHALIMGGAVLGEGCRLGHGAFVDRGVRAGNRLWMHQNAGLWRPFEFGDDVFVGPNCVFVNDPDPRVDLTRDLSNEKWFVGNGVCIGANCTILSDVNLGEYSFIGAGAVVSRSTVPFGVYVGVPARLVGYRCSCRARYKGDLPAECHQCGRKF